MSVQPNDVFRKSVLPIGLFLSIVGALCAIGFLLLPDDSLHSSMPELVSDPVWIRTFGVGGGTFYAVVGLGLCFRRRWAWITMLAIVGASSLPPWVGVMDGERGWDGFRTLLGRVLVSAPMLLLAIGLFFVTRPAFARRQIEADSLTK